MKVQLKKLADQVLVLTAATSGIGFAIKTPTMPRTSHKMLTTGSSVRVRRFGNMMYAAAHIIEDVAGDLY